MRSTILKRCSLIMLRFFFFCFMMVSFSSSGKHFVHPPVEKEIAPSTENGATNQNNNLNRPMSVTVSLELVQCLAIKLHGHGAEPMPKSNAFAHVGHFLAASKDNSWTKVVESK